MFVLRNLYAVESAVIAAAWLALFVVVPLCTVWAARARRARAGGRAPTR